MQSEGVPAVDVPVPGPDAPRADVPAAEPDGPFVQAEPAGPPDDYAVLPAEAAPRPPERPAALPVQPMERVAGVDVLRGFALMGILAMNILAFSWPDSAYESPRAGGNKSTVDLVGWAFNHVVFDEKMMTIFSMLFGAGLVLMTGRSDARGARLVWVYYRRVFWLLVIGLLHAYLVWHGDILVLYAECGFLLYLFRRRSPRTLITLGLLCVLVPVVLATYVSMLAQMSQTNYWGIRGTPRVILSTVGDLLNTKLSRGPEESIKKFNKVIETYRGGYLGIVRHRAPMLAIEQTAAFVFATLWMVGGRMLVGMGLMKLDVFSGRRSRRFYLWLVGLGYGLGLPAVLYDTGYRIAHDFRGAGIIDAKMVYGYLSALAIAMGHVGAVMLVYRSGAVVWLTRRLAAAGRMALSNYLTQSLVCTTLFYGYGFRLFGTMNRLELWGVVLAIWAFQLATSIIWLRYFRYGPAEWVWRSLTYWRFQPMLAGVPADVPEVAPASPASERSTRFEPAETVSVCLPEPSPANGGAEGADRTLHEEETFPPAAGG